MEKIRERKITIGNDKNILDLFFNHKLIIMLLFFPFFKTSGFESIPYLSKVSNLFLIIECIIFVFLSFLSKKNSKFLAILLIFELWNYIIVPIFGMTTMPSLFYGAGALGIVAMFELGMSHNPKKILDAVSLDFTIMNVLNFITTLVYKNGLPLSGETGVYLFGIRTGFPLVVIPAILICILYDYKYNNKKISKKTIICTLCGVLSIINKWVATGLVELTILVILFSFYRKGKHKFPKMSLCFLIIIIFNFFITIIGTKSNIFVILTSILKKDITLTGRTYIWELALNKVQMSPIFGHGLDSIINVYGIWKPAHNQWLHIALESGIVGLSIILLAFYISTKKLNKYSKEKTIYAIISAFMVAILIGCITEIQQYVPFIYMVFELPFLLKYLEKN